ncbi:DUF2797 domain-containing protein, partial [Bacteroidota bacterium]
MSIKAENDYAQYLFNIGEEKIEMNKLIGSQFILKYLNKINCIKCGKETKKSFAQGYCYPCFISTPETEECVLRPELCQAHKGIARDLNYAKNNCLIEHYVYLANTSGVKVGVTRNTQIPTRWLDQGAEQAIILAKTPNRYLAGLIEVELKKLMADKTNWRKMLTSKSDSIIDLISEKVKTINELPENLRRYIFNSNNLFNVKYPINDYPKKISSLNFDKQNYISGILKG